MTFLPVRSWLHREKCADCVGKGNCATEKEENEQWQCRDRNPNNVPERCKGKEDTTQYHKSDREVHEEKMITMKCFPHKLSIRDEIQVL